jgi:hypothetical protein
LAAEEAGAVVGVDGFGGVVEVGVDGVLSEAEQGEPPGGGEGELRGLAFADEAGAGGDGGGVGQSRSGGMRMASRLV